MALLLTILSVLALWAFLGLLATGLLLVFKTLESIRTNLERIAMGVRAIERQTAPLGAHATGLASRLDAAGAGHRLLATPPLVRRQHVGPSARHLHDGRAIPGEVPVGHAASDDLAYTVPAGVACSTAVTVGNRSYRRLEIQMRFVIRRALSRPVSARLLEKPIEPRAVKRVSVCRESQRGHVRVRLAGCALVALLAWAPGAAGNQTRDGNLRLTALDETLKELTARVLPAVVQIVVTGYTVRDEATTPGDLLAPQRTSGSGVILDPDGYVVTNAHVVEGATRIQVGLAAAPADQAPGRSILAARMRLVGAQIVGVDHETDLAVLKVNASALPALALGDSEQVAPGQVVLAFGSPFRLDGSVTLGVISATARQLAPESPVIHVQTDAPINPGSSGGPLVDTAGRVIGINTLIVSQSGMGQGLGFAVPSNIVRNVFEQLRKTGRVRRGEIGVRAQTITPALAAALGLTRTWGVILSDVYPGGPAAREGLRTDDVVLSLDGKIMENGRQLQVNLYSRAPGQRVQIEVLRGENRRTYGVMVVERAGDPTQLMERVTARQNLVPELGVLALDLPEELAGALPGLREPRGVVVAAVAGEQAGRFDGDALVAGDVIRAINLSPIATLGDLRAFLRQARRGQPIALHVERRGELRYLVMELE